MCLGGEGDRDGDNETFTTDDRVGAGAAGNKLHWPGNETPAASSASPAEPADGMAAAGPLLGVHPILCLTVAAAAMQPAPWPGNEAPAPSATS
jgi:hypothetical protein